MTVLLLLACETDPCAWAYGDWQQVGGRIGGADVPSMDATATVGAASWGYQPGGEATPDSAMLTAVDEDCAVIEVRQGSDEFRLERTDGGFELRVAPLRTFSFERR
ncbi:MAG: hypothetical protein GY871_18085 [Actinomycetales bacterium]|nr:hypothetical protein [Actinomycetales bacterium]